MKNTLLLIVVAFALAACHTTSKHKNSAQPKTSGKGTPAITLINDIWILEKLNGYPLETDSFDRAKPRIEIKTKEKMYFGFAGCNNLNGQLELTETTIQFKAGPMTRKACIEGNIEPAFVMALNSSRTYKVTNGKLELFDAKGKQICLFRKVD